MIWRHGRDTDNSMMLEDLRDKILEHLAHRRYGQAQYHLRRLVQEDPNDATTRSLLALCLAELGKFDEATEHAKRAVELEPDEPYCIWVLALVLRSRRKFKEALPHAQLAVERAPDDPDHFALLAQCHAGLGQWEKALLSAEQGLGLDPDHMACANLRALALQRTGRPSESDQAFIDAGSLDPENAFARAGRGWAALHQGTSPTDALPHFYHALHLDPTSEWARTGLLAALKARNPVYRMMLRYFLWMDSLKPRTRTLIMLGGIVLYGQLRRLARGQPSLAPIIYPLLALYVLFILLSWTADPLFDFLLRFDPAGRTLVTADRRSASNAVVTVLGIAIIAGAYAALTGAEQALLIAVVSGVLVFPVAGTFQCEAGWPRTVMAAYTIALAGAGLLGVFLPREQGAVFLVVSILGSVLGSWLARWLSGMVPAR